jgi:CubicO group peptidase (beta-lactamase class C family)
MRERRSRLVLAFFVAAAMGASGAVAAQSAPAAPAKAAVDASREAVRTMMARAKVPGVGVAVASGDAVIWSEGFGVADLEQGVPVTRETKFGIGSITKSLTMALFGRLMEERLVDLDAPLERSLPEFPHRGLGISVRLVAGHLSGLDDTFDSSARQGTAHYATTSEALAKIIREPLRHRPRTRHFYTTGPYTLIAGVVETATGRDFRALMAERVLAPLGLKHTVPNDRRAIVPDRTAFYVVDEATSLPVNAPYFDPSYKWAGAGYLSTAEDVARFGAAMMRPGFLTQATRDELFRPLETSDGENTGFALGWRVGKDTLGRRIVHQPGGGPGISCWLVLYPDHGLAIAVLSNQTGAPVGGRTLQAIADAFLAAR